MAQLDSYSLQDMYSVSVFSGFLSPYLAEETEATIESIVAYSYSANNISGKRRGVSKQKVLAGSSVDNLLTSFNFLGLTKTNFFNIEKPLDERVIWQDAFLTAWSLGASKKSLAKLEDRFGVGRGA